MIRALPLFLLFAACAHAPRAPREPDPAAAAREEARAFLAATYGLAPREGTRARRDLEDLLDREDRLAALRRPETVAFARDLAAVTCWSFEASEARELAAAPAGPPGRALADDTIRRFLIDLREGDLLSPHAGWNLLQLPAEREGDLHRLAAEPDRVDRIARLFSSFGYRFLPTDATAVLEERALGAADTLWLGALLTRLRASYRPTWRTELNELVARRDRVDALLVLAEEAGIRLSGAPAVLVLARLAKNHDPLDETSRERFLELADRTARPDARDFLHLLPLATVPGVVAVEGDLRNRWRYRFDPADGRALIVLVKAGVPEPALPVWVERDRVPLRRPEHLLSDEPARAFVDLNDLRFMESIEKSRPDLAGRTRDHLTRKIRNRLARIPRQLRSGAPYYEFEDDLDGFLRPDLLKAILLLDALDRPEVQRQIGEWLERDMADRSTELGGYVRLTPEGRLEFELAGVAGDADDRLRLAPDPEGAALDFHLHASDEDESAFAGPSSGGPGTDLFRAAEHRVDGVVITRMRGGRYNTDLYLSSKYVLDLGVRGPPIGTPKS